MADKDILRAINLLTELGTLLKKIRGGTFPTDLLSTFGELKVFLELRKQFPGSKIRFKRKARADISIGSVNIEIKTSNFKKEDYGEGYAFALQIKKCKQHPAASFEHPEKGKISGDLCYLDYLICMAVRESNLKTPDFYIFSVDELNSIAPEIKNKSRRFTSPHYRILIPIKPNPNHKGTFYNDFDLQLVENSSFKNKWDKININLTS